MFTSLIVNTTMNNMKSKDAKALKNLALSIGEFIRYWGFRRIHGAIWTQLYLSSAPLSGTELSDRLEVSKALISPALVELVEWKLIREVDSGDKKTRLFEAEPDVNTVIRHVLEIREKKLLAKISKYYGDLEALGENQAVDASRLESLGQMVGSAELMLQLLLAQKEVLDLPFKFEK
jgi:DNA-binding transcriptional regulator GbsR (MarR family)